MLASAGLTAGAAEHAPQDSAKALRWRLTLIYVYGCTVAIVVTFALVGLGLEFTVQQWLTFLAQMPGAVIVYTTLDLIVLRRHFRPLGAALSALDEFGQSAPPDVIGSGLVQAINMPFLAMMRVTFLHGPVASVLVVICTIGTEPWLHTGFSSWQGMAFAATVLFFASPTHAIFEYFGVAQEMVPHIVRLNGALGGIMKPEYSARLISVRLRSKLLYLAIFVTALPLSFFAVTMVFKFERIMRARGVATGFVDMLPLYGWIAGVVLTCMGGAIIMALLTANDVSRSASRLIGAMGEVEQGNLDDIRLDILTADEYADINRGFGHMVESLRDEQRILSISQDLSGELHLDVLIARIMQAATDLLNAERSTLFVADTKTGELFSLYAEGDHVREIRIPADRGIAGAVYLSGELENIPDAYDDPRFDQSVDKNTGFRTRNILCAPISNKAGGRIGVTQVLNKRTGAFTAKDESRLRAFSAQISVCLDNARLFDDVLSMKNYNESILQSTSNGIVTLDVDNRFVTANEAALTLLGLEQRDLIGKESDAIFKRQNGWIADSLDRSRKTNSTALAVDAEIIRPSGEAISANVTTAPLIDANNQNIGSMLVLEDISREKRVRSTMARYMSKEVADQLLESGEDALVGKDQRVSILFSDVRDFTSLAESASARETVSMLNEYFTDMVDVIFANGGILDKYIGDGMMALFGAPFAGDRDADHAIAAANQMVLALAELNIRRAKAGGVPIKIGLGVSTGDVVVGNIGSNKRMEYTVIGDSVNLASRLEGANKFYGTQILFSQFTMGDLSAPALVREIDTIRVKGKEKPVLIYETLDWRAGEAGLDEMLGAYAAGRAAFAARDWRASEAAFEQAMKAMPGDTPAALHRDRARQFSLAPPAAEWDGVWTLPGK